MQPCAAEPDLISCHGENTCASCVYVCTAEHHKPAVDMGRECCTMSQFNIITTSSLHCTNAVYS